MVEPSRLELRYYLRMSYDYKNRITKGIEAIITIADKNIDQPHMKDIRRIAEAQVANLKGIENTAS